MHLYMLLCEPKIRNKYLVSCILVPVLVLHFVALWFILRGGLSYILPCVILFLCLSVLLALRLPRLGKRELILMLFVRLFDLRLFGFVGFLFLLVSGKSCGLWLWHSLDFSLTFFDYLTMLVWKYLCNLQPKLKGLGVGGRGTCGAVGPDRRCSYNPNLVAGMHADLDICCW